MEQLQAHLSTDSLLALLEQIPVGVLVTDSDGNITWSNKIIAAYVGKSPEALLQLKLDELKQSQLRPISKDSDTILVPGADKMLDRWLKHSAVSIEDGKYVANFYNDITEVSNLLARQDELVEQLNHLSTSDPVSGLLNHRAMLQHLEPLVSRSRRYGNHLSVIAMEVLNADAIRKQYGEEAFNATMVEISRLLKDQMRWADILSRTEDQRFVFVLPETDNQSAVHLANKIAAQLAELVVTFNGHSLHVQTGFGVSGWEKGNDSVLLLRRASQALDSAKRQGHGAVESL